MKTIFWLLLGLALLAGCAYPAVPRYGVYEITLKGTPGAANPYVTTQLAATFTHLKTGRQYAAEGFWDGDNVFKVRFAPTLVGKWKYQVTSNDSALNGRHGVFECAPSDSPGFVRVDERHPHHFCYDDGTHFYFAAVTIGLLSGSSPTIYTKFYDFDTYKQVVDTRVKQGFNVAFSLPGIFAKTAFNDRKQSNEGGPPFFEYDASRLNPDYFKWIDKRMEYLQAKGILTMLGLGWPDQQVLRNGQDNVERAWRYVIARYSAYNVIWNLFGEYDEFGPDAEKITVHFARLTRKYDPYNHPLGTHATSSSGPMAARHPDLFDYIIEQTRDWNLVSRDYAFGKPVVNAEYYYENKLGIPTRWSHIVDDTNLIRTGALEIRSRGGYFDYEIWGYRLNWPHNLETSGTRYVMYVNQVYRSLPYWKLEPSQDLVDSGNCLSDHKTCLICYLPKGGPVTVNLQGFEAPLRARWYDAKCGKYFRAPQPAGDSLKATAPSARDWLLVIDPKPVDWQVEALPEAPVE